MKKIKMLVVLIAVSIIANAQNDSLVKIKTLYAGALMGSKCDADTFKVSKWASLRVGGWVTADLSQKFDIQSWGILHQEVGASPYALATLWADYKPRENFKISFGNLPTPVAELRPHPVSGDGQFETWTEALLPGVATGIKFGYVTGKFEAKAGGFVRNDGEKLFSVKVAQGPIALAGYVGDRKMKGAGLTVDNKYFYTVVSVTEQNVGNFVSIKTKYFNIFSDTGIDNDRKLVRGEWGILYNFSVGKWSGLIAMSYQYETGTINNYLYIHL